MSLRRLSGAESAPVLLPVVSEKIYHPPVTLVETVRHLEDREGEAAFRPGPRFVAAARGAPYEVARLARAFAAVEDAFQDVSLLDEDMLVVRQSRARCHLREHGEKAGLRIRHQRLGLHARMACLLPRQRRDADEARGERREPGVTVRFRRACGHLRTLPNACLACL